MIPADDLRSQNGHERTQKGKLRVIPGGLDEAYNPDKFPRYEHE